MQIRQVPFREILSDPNAKELLEEYAAECSIPEIGEAVPQEHLYQRLEDSGGMKAFGVYDGELLIGFAAVLHYVLPHYGKQIATTESIFIAKSHRNSQAGRLMMNAIEDYAAKLGCVAFLYSAPVGSRFSNLLSLNVGRYRRTNHVYLRSL